MRNELGMIICRIKEKNIISILLLFVSLCLDIMPRSGKNIWKMRFSPGQGKVRDFCGWPGKFRKDLESQGI